MSGERVRALCSVTLMLVVIGGVAWAGHAMAGTWMGSPVLVAAVVVLMVWLVVTAVGSEVDR